MYEELVKSLRTTVKLYEAVGQDGLVTTQLIKQAADAIEELWNEVKAHRMRYGWVDSEDGGQDDV